MGSGGGTLFAPAERADARSIARDAEILIKTGLVEHVTHVIPTILTILNRQRQVVYTNQRLIDFLGASSNREILGKRPGELLNCIHAFENLAGCGTTEFCRECGAVRAILTSQREKVGVEEECRIIATSGAAFELRVWASPYTLRGKDYTIFSVLDIGDQKRREVLERTFFHDVNDILTVIVAHSDRLDSADSPEAVAKSVAAIRGASEKIAAEVASQRALVRAEKGDLRLELECGVRAVGLVDELVHSASVAWPDRRIVRGEDCDDCVITTDRTLLYRVLYNMVKNAVEASAASEEVSIRSTRREAACTFSIRNPNFMPRSTQLQVFQRSFSTKGSGRGLGTYSMKLLGERYLKGQVWFSTSEDEGTIFSISVPLFYRAA